MQPRFQNQTVRVNLNRQRNQKLCNEFNEQNCPQNRGKWTSMSNHPMGSNLNSGPRVPRPDPGIQKDFGYNQSFVNNSVLLKQNETSFLETSNFQDRQHNQMVTKENMLFPGDGNRSCHNQIEVHGQQSFPNEHPPDLPANNYLTPPPSIGMGPLPPSILPAPMNSFNRPTRPPDSPLNMPPLPLDYNINMIPNIMAEQHSLRMPQTIPPPKDTMHHYQNSNQHFQLNTYQNHPQANTSMLLQTQPNQLQNQHSDNHQHLTSQMSTQVVLKEKESGPTHAQNKWLQQFLHNRKRKIQQLCQKPMLKICDVQHKMRKMMFLMAELQQQIKKLESCTTFSENDWIGETNKVHNSRNELDILKRELQNEENIKALHVKIESRKRKRGRLKRLRKERYEEKQTEMAKREENTRKIDEWRDKITQEELRQKEEKELKSTADVILNEVRKKLMDANKTIELLHGLQKLRMLRRDRLERQGVITKSDMNEQFETDLQEQLSIMQKQQEIYVAEEKALKVMLETEHEETKVKEHEKSRLQHEEDQNRLLFGHEELHSIDESLFPYWQFYHQANLKKESLVQIRREWDAFLVPETTAGGSRIPDWWVGPSQPSSDIWASALKNK